MRGNGGVLSSTRARARARGAWKRTAAVLLAAVLCPVVLAGSTSAATTPTIVLTPRTDLVDGSVVAVTGSGYVPNQFYLVGECKVGACTNFIGTFASAAGTIATNFTARVSPPGFSCLTESSFVGILRGTPPFPFIVATPLWFRNTGGSVAGHTISATPAAGLSDGQVVNITGANFYSGWTPIRACVLAPVLACSIPPVVTWADPAGSFTAPFTVQRSFDGQEVTATADGYNGVPFHVDCLDPVIAPNGCVIEADQGGVFTPEGISSAVPITFAAATKDDCKDGGWQRVVDSDGTPFKNQGQCVSFVARGGA